MLQHDRARSAAAHTSGETGAWPPGNTSSHESGSGPTNRPTCVVPSSSESAAPMRPSWETMSNNELPADYQFTVFTGTHNRAHTISRVYESLKAQSYRDFEWLVVDNESTDGTPELMARWQKEAPFPIRYLYHANRGQHGSLNRAVCRGPWGVLPSAGLRRQLCPRSPRTAEVQLGNHSVIRTPSLSGSHRQHVRSARRAAWDPLPVRPYGLGLLGDPLPLQG